MPHNICIPLAIQSYFSPEECRKIIESSAGQPLQEGVAGYEGEVSELRDSQITAIVPDESNTWLYKKLQGAALSANEQYQFDISGFQEGLQVARYAQGGYFDWHLDIGSGTQSARKFSISVQLCDGDDYTGGDLEFVAVENQKIPRGVGDVVIFPSFLAHRVTPVTRGVRWSLVAWVHGPAFR